MLTKDEISIESKEEQRGSSRYILFSCNCNPHFYGPYEQMVLHLTTSHKFTLQEAEITLHFSRKSDINPDDYL